MQDTCIDQGLCFPCADAQKQSISRLVTLNWSKHFIQCSDVNNETLVDRTYIKRLGKFSWVVWRTMLAPQWGWYGAESPYENFEHFKVVVLA